MKYDITILPTVSISNLGQVGVKHLSCTPRELYDNFSLYQNKSSSIKDEQKHFILARYKDYGGSRVTENIEYYSSIVIDFDSYGKNYNEFKDDIFEVLGNYTYIYYTTASHSFDNPHIRLIVFTSRTFTPDEKTSILNGLIKRFNIDLVNAIDQHNAFTNNSLSRLPYKSPDFEMSYNEQQPYYIGEHIQTFNNDNTHDLTTSTAESEEESAFCEKEFKIQSNNLPVADLTTDKIKTYLEEYKELVGYNEDGEFDTYDDWLEVGLILHHQFQGSDEGLQLWMDVSFQYDEKIKYTWRHFKLDKENPKTFKTIIHKLSINKRNNVALCDPKAPPLLIDKTKKICLETLPHYSETKTGLIKPKDTYDNFVAIMKFYNIDLGFDIITKKATLFGENDQNIAEVDIFDLLEINGISSKTRGRSYINRYAAEKKYNSFYNLLTADKWDGVYRLNDFYDTIKVKKEHEEIKKKYLLSFLKQLIYISCFSTKYPYKSKKISRLVLVFQSKQQNGKSTWVKNLLPHELERKYITIGSSLRLDDDKHNHGNLTKLIVELGELEKSFKHSDVNAIKAFFGRTHDTLKVLYVNNPVEYERTTSFIATTNDLYFLRDVSGSTRFLVLPLDEDYRNEEGLPILCNGRHNIDMVQLYRQVFWSEDWINYELDKEDMKIQESINEQFTMNDTMEDLFLEEFTTEINHNAPLYNCTDILRKLGYSTTTLHKKVRNDLATMLRKYNFPYVAMHKKFRLVARRKEVTSNDSEVQKEAY